ncbi:MAG: helix-turn-helix transcriptional regulator [Treponema sp.]|nr:helix-turn-helix transcriptional regulator [Treponema sp.]
MNLSQEELAEKVGISTTHMSHIETGSTKLSLPVLVELAKSLNVKTDSLLFNHVCSDNAVTIKLLQQAILNLQ